MRAIVLFAFMGVVVSAVWAFPPRNVIDISVSTISNADIKGDEVIASDKKSLAWTTEVHGEWTAIRIGHPTDAYRPRDIGAEVRDDDPKYVRLIGYLQYDEVGGVRVVEKFGLGCLWKMKTEKIERRTLERRDEGTGSEANSILSAAPAAAELSEWGLVFKDGKLRLAAKEKSAAIFRHYRYFNLHPSGK